MGGMRARAGDLAVMPFLRMGKAATKDIQANDSSSIIRFLAEGVARGTGSPGEGFTCFVDSPSCLVFLRPVRILGGDFPRRIRSGVAPKLDLGTAGSVLVQGAHT